MKTRIEVTFNHWLWMIAVMMLPTAILPPPPANAQIANQAFDLELDMSDADRWIMDTVHLGTKQVAIAYDADDRAAVMTPTWSASDATSEDVGVRNIENGRLQLYQLIEAQDCTQAITAFEISMPQEYIAEGKLELVFALQAGAKGDYLFNARTFNLDDFADSGGKFKKLIVNPSDFNEPSEKLRAIERVSFIFERRGSLISAPVKIRCVTIDLNSEKITPPAKEVRVKNPASFYEFAYTTQADADGIEARVSAESMDITRRINDAKDGVALIPQWKEGQIPDGHSGRVTLVQPLGAINDFETFRAQYVLNIPKAYFDEGKIDIWLFIQAGEAGYYRWSGTQRSLASFADKAGQDVVLTMTEEDVRDGKKRNQIEVMGLQINRNGSTLTEPIMFKRITIKLPESETPIDESFVNTHGQLSVQGTKLVDAQGNPIVLRGVSYGWHNWWHQFYNAESVGWLADDWKCTVVRAAMGVGPAGSYLDRPEWSEKLVRTVVDAAIANGIYVIIDWHDHNAHEHTDEAIAFFTKMAAIYKDQPNVIYEIYNEPVRASWPEVKRYSKKVIDAIRAIDPDNIILVGSPHWDQDVHLAADDPLVGETNVMYTLHFYADTHKQELRDRGDYALSKGLPLFVSEHGGCAANGDGPLNMIEWKAWIDWAEKHQVSWVTWSISSKNESCSMLPAKAANTGNWPVNTLKPSGAHTRTLLRQQNCPSNSTSGDNDGDQKQTKETTKQSAFSWSSDCSSENTFVNSTHSIIPGHYEYLPDPAGKGTVFRGRLTGDMKIDDPESVHLHPDIYFDKFHPGSFTVSFDVWVDDLKPDVLGPYREKPWLNVVTIFDRTTRSGDKRFEPSVMTNLVGSPGAYYLQTYSMSPREGGTFFDKETDALAFPTGQWVSVKLEVDVDKASVKTFQDGTLVSTGPYKSRPGIAGAHMGLYTNRLIKQATVYNRNCAVTIVR